MPSSKQACSRLSKSAEFEVASSSPRRCVGEQDSSAVLRRPVVQARRPFERRASRERTVRVLTQRVEELRRQLLSIAPR